MAMGSEGVGADDWGRRKLPSFRSGAPVSARSIFRPAANVQAAASSGAGQSSASAMAR